MSDTNFDYATVFHKMTQDEVDEANMAMDIYQNMVKKSLKKH